jgi:hypothetical protein
MKLTEITVDGQEPLLIVMLRKLLDKGDRIWFKGNFSLLQVKGIGKLTVDQPAVNYLDREEYHGSAYDIKVHHGMGPVITPPEAETKWELVKREPNPASTKTEKVQDWELKRVKK